MQIISTYSSSDRSELNYHTGVTMHNAVDVNNIKVIHRGVQYMDGKEDIILAGLLFFAMKDPSIVLSKVVFDVYILKHELLELVEESTSITCQHASQSFCETVTQQVKLFCICHQVQK